MFLISGASTPPRNLMGVILTTPVHFTSSCHGECSWVRSGKEASQAGKEGQAKGRGQRKKKKQKSKQNKKVPSLSLFLHRQRCPVVFDHLTQVTESGVEDLLPDASCRALIQTLSTAQLELPQIVI